MKPISTFRPSGTITSYVRHAVAMLTLGITLCACSKNTPPVSVETASTRSSPVVSRADRIAQVTRILTEQNNLPSEIIDAYFDEQTLGPPDPSGYAPVDYVSYMYLKVRRNEISQWDRLLIRKLGYVPKLNPDEDYPWWLNGKIMTDFEFFEPHPLSSRDGFIAVSRKTGEIWIYGFTM